MAKKSNTGKREKLRERRERRFEPLASVSAKAGLRRGRASGAICDGRRAPGASSAATCTTGGPEPFKFAPYILAAGALLVGVAIRIGTSGEPTLRVGDAGLALEKGGLRRMPWYAIERIEWRGETVRVTGKDENGSALTVTASLKSQPQAAAWIVREARERVPAVVDVPDDATLPEPRAAAGVVVPLEAPQVVGKHCAASGKVIAYEPDARVCPRCERVYHKASVPDACECGASLTELKVQASAG